MGGLIAYGAYIPYNRLKRSRIAEVLGSGGGPGSRAVASFDEDTTSMGAEAARAALRMLAGGPASVRQLYFATAAPAYLDKTNANVVHAALETSTAAGTHARLREFDSTVTGTRRVLDFALEIATSHGHREHLTLETL